MEQYSLRDFCQCGLRAFLEKNISLKENDFISKEFVTKHMKNIFMNVIPNAIEFTRRNKIPGCDDMIFEELKAKLDSCLNNLLEIASTSKTENRHSAKINFFKFKIASYVMLMTLSNKSELKNEIGDGLKKLEKNACGESGAFLINFVNKMKNTKNIIKNIRQVFEDCNINKKVIQELEEENKDYFFLKKKRNKDDYEIIENNIPNILPLPPESSQLLKSAGPQKNNKTIDDFFSREDPKQSFKNINKKIELKINIDKEREKKENKKAKVPIIKKFELSKKNSKLSNLPISPESNYSTQNTFNSGSSSQVDYGTLFEDIQEDNLTKLNSISKNSELSLFKGSNEGRINSRLSILPSSHSCTSSNSNLTYRKDSVGKSSRGINSKLGSFSQFLHTTNLKIHKKRNSASLTQKFIQKSGLNINELVVNKKNINNEKDRVQLNLKSLVSKNFYGKDDDENEKNNENQINFESQNLSTPIKDSKDVLAYKTPEKNKFESYEDPDLQKGYKKNLCRLFAQTIQ